MALEVQNRVCELVGAVHGGSLGASPEWLNRPAKQECGRRWPTAQRIYRELTGRDLPDEMPSRERRSVDMVLRKRGQGPRIVEVDETQHFNAHRATTIRLYPRTAKVAFDRPAWLRACEAKKRLEGGGFARPCPPLFPDQGGRHQQRAYRDALADLLPSVHGWEPTLRIAYFEVEDWLWGSRAMARMRALLTDRVI